eukprot:g17113.t1
MEDLEEIFDYNRENFRFDAKQWQERGFQEQKMRVDQGQLYRDDVRDLMELTTGKMDLYLIMPYGPPGKKKSIRLLCKGHLDAAPEWLRWLSSLSLCAGFLMFFLSLWLAMHASVASHSFATRLLTQYVRLPIPSDKQLDALQLRFDEFEGYKARDMLRVPLIKVAAKKLEASLKASSSKKRKSEGGVRFPFFGSLLRKNNNTNTGAGTLTAAPAGEGGGGDRQAATAAPTSSVFAEEDGVEDAELQQAEQIEVTSLEHVN